MKNWSLSWTIIRLPQTLRKHSAEMIIVMLQANPEKRPTVQRCLTFPFLKNQFIPKSLPSSCLSCEPRIDQIEGAGEIGYNRKPLHEVNDNNNQGTHDDLNAFFWITLIYSTYRHFAYTIIDYIRSNFSFQSSQRPHSCERTWTIRSQPAVLFPKIISITSMTLRICLNNWLNCWTANRHVSHTTWATRTQTRLLSHYPGYRNGSIIVINTALAINCVMKAWAWCTMIQLNWLCYRTECKCINELQLLFWKFDRFSISHYSNVHFIDREGNEKYMTITEYPKELEKKMKLLSYFKRYMTEHLVKAGGNASGAAGDVLSRIPHMHTWFRTTVAVVMHLTNGSVQVIE